MPPDQEPQSKTTGLETQTPRRISARQTKRLRHARGADIHVCRLGSRAEILGIHNTRGIPVFRWHWLFLAAFRPCRGADTQCPCSNPLSVIRLMVAAARLPRTGRHFDVGRPGASGIPAGTPAAGRPSLPSRFRPQCNPLQAFPNPQIPAHPNTSFTGFRNSR